MTILLLPIAIILVSAFPALSQIPTDGLVAYYPFNGNAIDESGNGNNGVVSGASLVQDRFGNPLSAYDFDGINDLISVGSGSSLAVEGDLTISVWLKAETLPLPNRTFPIINRGAWGETEDLNYFYHFFLINIDGSVYLGNAHEYGAGNNQGANSTRRINPNEWLHAVLVRNSVLKTYSFHINGVPELDQSYEVNPTGGSNTTGDIGWVASAAIDFFNGIIDDVRVYEKVLTDEEILALYNEGSGDPIAAYGVHYGTTGSAEPNDPGALITIHLQTGVGTLIGPTGIMGDTGPSVPAIAIKSTGEIYGVSASTNSGLYTINASTGAGTFVANTGVSLPNAMAFDGYDQLYITDGSGNLYTLDETTGSTALIGPIAFNVRGIGFDPTDGTMYASSGTDGIYTIDPTTAVATFVGNTGLGGSTPDIHFDLDGNLYGTKIGAGTISNYASINKQTGAGTVVGATGFTAVIGLSARQVRSDVVPVTLEIGIDPEDQTVPPAGATFPYAMTLTNNTPRTQTTSYWTKLVRPTGNPFDPFDGPTSLTLDPFEILLVDTNEVAVPPNAPPGEYSLIGYVGTRQVDTVDIDTTGFTKLDDSIPCGDIAQFKARCRPEGLIQAKAIFTDFTHVGETVEISIDQFAYEVTVGINGQAVFSQSGFNPGVHTVELTDPDGCFPAVQVACPAGLSLDEGEEWDDSWEAPTTTALLGNYPNPFNPSTTFRYGLSEPAQVSLKVYNMLGQLVRTIVDEQQFEGYHEAVWDGRNDIGATVSSGIYIYRMNAGSFVETKRMLLVK